MKIVLFYYFNLLFSIIKREIFWKAEALLLQNPFGSLYFMDKVRYFKSWSSDASEIHRFILFLVFIKWEIFESWSFVASEIHRFTLFLVYKVRDIWELKLVASEIHSHGRVLNLSPQKFAWSWSGFKQKIARANKGSNPFSITWRKIGHFKAGFNESFSLIWKCYEQVIVCRGCRNLT